jgi:hypothetical protein
MKSFPVQFVTASQGPRLYPDLAQNRVFSTQEIAEIARQVQPEVSFQVHGDCALSPSEVLPILNKYVTQSIGTKSDAALTLDSTPYGQAGHRCS